MTEAVLLVGGQGTRLRPLTVNTPKPMLPAIANHVAALVLFGRPSPEFMTDIGAPPIAIGPAYVAKTIELCVPDDTICNGAPAGGPSFAHITYGSNGMADQAATFVVSRL